MSQPSNSSHLKTAPSIFSTPPRTFIRSESGPATTTPARRSERNLKKLSSFTSLRDDRDGSIPKRSYSSGDYSPPSTSPPMEPFSIPITPSRENTPLGSEDHAPLREIRLPESQYTVMGHTHGNYTSIHSSSQGAPPVANFVASGASTIPPITATAPGNGNIHTSTGQGQSASVSGGPARTGAVGMNHFHGMQPPPQNQYHSYQPHQQQPSPGESTSPSYPPAVPAQEKLSQRMTLAPPPMKGSPPRLHITHTNGTASVQDKKATHHSTAPPPPPTLISSSTVPRSSTSSIPPAPVTTTAAASTFSGGQSSVPPSGPQASGYGPGQSQVASGQPAPTQVYAPPPLTSAGHSVPLSGILGPPPISAAGYKTTSSGGTGTSSRRRQQQEQQHLRYTSSPGSRLPSKPKSRSPPRSRIDTSQMPRPKPPDPTSPPLVYHTKSSTAARKVPPPSTTLFTAVDSGNASPRAMRITTTAPPSTKAIANSTTLPLAVVSTPFAMPENDECEVSLVDMKAYGNDDGNPPRCLKCRAYINPYVTWIQGGTRWTCNLCGTSNITENWYYCSLDGSQQRLDRFNKAELFQGSVDFMVTEDYCVTPPQELVYVFCVDSSPRAIASGAMSASISAIQHTVHELYKWATGKRGRPDMCPELNEGITMVDTDNRDNDEDEEGCEGGHTIRIGIMTFGHDLNYYWIRPAAHDPIGIHVVHPDDPCPALPPDKWLLKLCAEISSINLLLRRLPHIIRADPAFQIANAAAPAPAVPVSSAGFAGGGGGQKSTAAVSDFSRHLASYSCPAAALKAAQMALENIGGRIVLLTDSNPDIGYGKMRRRPKMSVYGTENEFCYYGRLGPVLSCQLDAVIQSAAEEKAAMQLYVDLAGDLARQNTCVDVFFFTPSLNSHAFLDMGTAAPRTGHTSQQHHHASSDNSAVYAELCRTTGGSLRLFSGSNHLEDNLNRLKSELLHSVQIVTGAEAVMKLRCSAGFRVDEYYGPGVHNLVTDEVALAGVDREISCCFTLKNEASLKDGDPMYIQLAVLYTSLPSSQRIVRVHNIVLHTSTDPMTIFRHSDADCVVSYLLKMAVDHALRYPLLPQKPSSKNYVLGGSRRTNDIRQRLIDVCIDILLHYRQLCSPNSPKGQLILPESLKALPLYTLCILKHPCFMQNSAIGSSSASGGGQGTTRLAVDACERSFVLNNMLRCCCRESMLSLYPRMYPLHDLDEGDGHHLDVDDCKMFSRSADSFADSDAPDGDDDSVKTFDNDSELEMTDDLSDPAKKKYLVQMPLWKKCSAESIDSAGIYLLDDGELLWLYFGRCVSQEMIKDLLGISPGGSPPASNASPKVTGMKGLRGGAAGRDTVGKTSPPRSPLRIVTSSGEVCPPSLTTASFGSEKLLLRLGSSGTVPPALQPRSENAKRVQNIMQCARINNPHRPGALLCEIVAEHMNDLRYYVVFAYDNRKLKIVWGGEINSSGADVLRFGVRLVEDSIYGTIDSLY